MIGIIQEIKFTTNKGVRIRATIEINENKYKGIITADNTFEHKKSAFTGVKDFYAINSEECFKELFNYVNIKINYINNSSLEERDFLVEIDNDSSYPYITREQQIKICNNSNLAFRKDNK